MKAQLMNYEAIRPMFEAHVINRPTSTGVVQWMLNSPWPEFYWQLYDYYLMPTGAYYGTKKAGQPLNVVYDYFNRTLHVSNDTRAAIKGYQAEVKLLDQNSKVVFEQEQTVDLAENTVQKWEQLPVLHGKNQVYFLSLKLKNAVGEVVADNFYWLPTKTDELDWKQYFWFYTPQKQYADFTALNTLPKVKLQIEKTIKEQGDEYEVAVKLTNSSDKVAFFIELELAKDAKGAAILPVFWTDNYVSLLPGETKTVSVKCYKKDADNKAPAVRVKGYNLEKGWVL
jgi:exo-1,4-beta-D-glucosaminidase